MTWFVPEWVSLTINIFPPKKSFSSGKFNLLLHDHRLAPATCGSRSKGLFWTHWRPLIFRPPNFGRKNRSEAVIIAGSGPCGPSLSFLPSNAFNRRPHRRSPFPLINSSQWLPQLSRRDSAQPKETKMLSQVGCVVKSLADSNSSLVAPASTPFTPLW